MTRLSVNLNKVALLRNSRSNGIPSVVRAAELSIAAGAQGVTVHPRPDQRHVRPADVHALANYLRDFPAVEFNIEGNPFPDFLELVRAARPHQCTLVPDSVDTATSDHGWNLEEYHKRLAPIVAQLRDMGTRVSLFMEVGRDQWLLARELGADRVELYTQPYAEAHARGQSAPALAHAAAATRGAQTAGLGVNAGHDLNRQNLGEFCSIPGILEVSIGHALIADALEVGLPAAVRAYLVILSESSTFEADRAVGVMPPGNAPAAATS
jgi:pyridoxine 5-phosphate synthase